MSVIKFNLVDLLVMLIERAGVMTRHDVQVLIDEGILYDKCN